MLRRGAAPQRKSSRGRCSPGPKPCREQPRRSLGSMGGRAGGGGRLTTLGRSGGGHAALPRRRHRADPWGPSGRSTRGCSGVDTEPTLCRSCVVPRPSGSLDDPTSIRCWSGAEILSVRTIRGRSILGRCADAPVTLGRSCVDPGRALFHKCETRRHGWSLPKLPSTRCWRALRAPLGAPPTDSRQPCVEGLAGALRPPAGRSRARAVRPLRAVRAVRGGAGAPPLRALGPLDPWGCFGAAPWPVQPGAPAWAKARVDVLAR